MSPLTDEKRLDTALETLNVVQNVILAGPDMRLELLFKYDMAQAFPIWKAAAWVADVTVMCRWTTHAKTTCSHPGQSHPVHNLLTVLHR